MRRHPFALHSNNGALGMRAGDWVLHEPDGRVGRADEFLQDGEAYITWEDGTFGTVLWNNLRPTVSPKLREAYEFYRKNFTDGRDPLKAMG